MSDTSEKKFNVVSIDSGKPIVDTRVPDADLIEHARKILEMAESGQIKSIRCVMSLVDETVSWISCGKQIQGNEIAALDQVKMRLLEKW
jgi:hypothetical protein